MEIKRYGKTEVKKHDLLDSRSLHTPKKASYHSLNREDKKTLAPLSPSSYQQLSPNSRGMNAQELLKREQQKSQMYKRQVMQLNEEN